jgi:hypothetical protein
MGAAQQGLCPLKDNQTIINDKISSKIELIIFPKVSEIPLGKRTRPDNRILLPLVQLPPKGLWYDSIFVPEILKL